MNNELTLYINSKESKVFLQKGFYNHSIQSTKLHKHNYAEIHLVAEKDAEFIIDGKTHNTQNGNLLVIPHETTHAFKLRTNRCHNTAFQIDYPFEKLACYSIPQTTALDFLSEIDLARKTGNHTKIAGYIQLFCSFLSINQNLKATSITDYGFLIEEFFSNRYGENIHLSDLANILHLSPRQTERLVIKHTGKTFREELCDIRIRTAKYLQDNTSMSLSQICNYVGYQSYAGFYKAMKNHKSKF